MLTKLISKNGPHIAVIKPFKLDITSLVKIKLDLLNWFNLIIQVFGKSVPSSKFREKYLSKRINKFPCESKALYQTTAQ